MKQFSRKFLLVTLLLLSFQAVLFSEEKKTEKKSAFTLAKEIAELKVELFKIDNRLEEYESISDLDLSFTKAKKERMLRKRNKELLEAVNNNKDTALNFINNAVDNIVSKAKELKDKGKDFLEYLKDYFNE